MIPLQIGDQTNTSRIEIALYGDIVPQTCENFKLLATGAKGYGYKDTEIFRLVTYLASVISQYAGIHTRCRRQCEALLSQVFHAGVGE